MSEHSPEVPAAAAGSRHVDGLPFPVSRRTDAVSLRPGTRVIVRYLVPEGKATDIIGILRSVDPLVVDKDGAKQTIAADQVVVLKTLSSTPVRNSDIRAVETAKAAAFPGITNQWCGGWLARAGDGITERSNSAVPLGPSAGLQPVPVEQIREFYRAHNLPTLLLVPDRIGRTAEHLAGERGPEIIVMTRELDTVETGEGHAFDIRFDDQPTQEWLSMYHFRGQPLPERALRLLSERIDGQICFASLWVDGQLAAITRGTITQGGARAWLGFSAVEVAEEFRRRGLASALCSAIMDWGHRHGADCTYLDVVESNVAGRALYHRLGFSEHHRHRSLHPLG